MGAVHMIVIGTTLVLAVAHQSAAQQVPRVEAGVLVSAPGSEFIGLGTRIGVSVSPRSMLEAGGEWMDLGRTRRYADQIVWLYYVQGRRTLRGTPGDEPSVFLTYGATGFAERTTRPRGMVLFYLPPLLPTAGIGWQSASPGRMSIRIDAQSLWLVGEYLLVPRFTVGAVLRVR